MNKNNWLSILFALVALLLPAAVFAAQDGPGLQLALVRNFGYGGLGKIQGNFTLKISNPPEGLKEVQFFVDEELLGVVKAEPFQYKFHTSSYADGEHTMYALGILADGTDLGSNQISKVFLSTDQAFGETSRIVAPLLIGTAVLTLLGTGLPILLNKNKEFELGKYGPAGGVVCPRCEMPFSRSVMSPNLVVGKLSRCPHCRKISILARASSARLQEAEARYARKDDPGMIHSGKTDLQKQVDESRFEN